MCDRTRAFALGGVNIAVRQKLKGNTNQEVEYRAVNMNLIKYVKGDLFCAPAGAILAHSCNCRGSWGGGVAAVFRRKFPGAYKTYENHCAKHAPTQLLGTCLMIPTDISDPGTGDYIIACLFTSDLGGGGADAPDQILRHTKSALGDLKEQLQELDNPSQPVYMPKINAGIFRVPWEDTEAVLKESDHNYVVYEL